MEQVRNIDNKYEKKMEKQKYNNRIYYKKWKK